MHLLGAYMSAVVNRDRTTVKFIYLTAPRFGQTLLATRFYLHVHLERADRPSEPSPSAQPPHLVIVIKKKLYKRSNKHEISNVNKLNVVFSL